MQNTNIENDKKPGEGKIVNEDNRVTNAQGENENVSETKTSETWQQNVKLEIDTPSTSPSTTKEKQPEMKNSKQENKPY